MRSSQKRRSGGSDSSEDQKSTKSKAENKKNKSRELLRAKRSKNLNSKPSKRDETLTDLSNRELDEKAAQAEKIAAKKFHQKHVEDVLSVDLASIDQSIQPQVPSFFDFNNLTEFKELNPKPVDLVPAPLPVQITIQPTQLQQETLNDPCHIPLTKPPVTPNAALASTLNTIKVPVPQSQRIMRSDLVHIPLDTINVVRSDIASVIDTRHIDTGDEVAPGEIEEKVEMLAEKKEVGTHPIDLNQRQHPNDTLDHKHSLSHQVQKPVHPQSPLSLLIPTPEPKHSSLHIIPTSDHKHSPPLHAPASLTFVAAQTPSIQTPSQPAPTIVGETPSLSLSINSATTTTTIQLASTPAPAQTLTQVPASSSLVHLSFFHRPKVQTLINNQGDMNGKDRDGDINMNGNDRDGDIDMNGNDRDEDINMKECHIDNSMTMNRNLLAMLP